MEKYVKFENYKKSHCSWFVQILVPEDNGRQKEVLNKQI